jgi:hypothetical protein
MVGSSVGGGLLGGKREPPAAGVPVICVTRPEPAGAGVPRPGHQDAVQFQPGRQQPQLLARLARDLAARRGLGVRRPDQQRAVRPVGLEIDPGDEPVVEAEQRPADSGRLGW